MALAAGGGLLAVSGLSFLEFVVKSCKKKRAPNKELPVENLSTTSKKNTPKPSPIQQQQQPVSRGAHVIRVEPKVKQDPPLGESLSARQGSIGGVHIIPKQEIEIPSPPSTPKPIDVSQIRQHVIHPSDLPKLTDSEKQDVESCKVALQTYIENEFSVALLRYYDGKNITLLPNEIFELFAAAYLSNPRANSRFNFQSKFSKKFSRAVIITALAQLREASAVRCQFNIEHPPEMVFSGQLDTLGKALGFVWEAGDPDKIKFTTTAHLAWHWTDDFEMNKTKDAPFTTNTGKRVMVPTMEGEVGSYQGNTTTGKPVFMACKEAMIGQTKVRFFAHPVTKDRSIVVGFPRFLGEMVHLKMPKWKFSLRDENFKEFAAQQGIHTLNEWGIDKGTFQVNVSVDEKGGEVKQKARLFSYRSSIKTIDLNSPFVYYIVDTEGVILAIGVVNDPSQS